ncbi:MAG: trigger factor [Candidatus Methylomirabilia bacterium]
MNVAVEELDACRRRLKVEAPLELVRKAWEDAYGRVQRQARLPGFRRGHVPRNLIRLHFSDEVRREVGQRLVPDAYQQAVAEARLRPVEEADIEQITLEEDAPLSFTAVVEVKPEIKLESYEGLTVEHTPVQVTEADVEQVLSNLREGHALLRSVDRPADPGDLVVVDYTLAPDGLAPRSEQGCAFQVGSQSVLPEVEEAVIGLSTGGEREVRVRFPDDHPREEFRGKSGTARVSVKEVKEKILPPLDDDFARGLGEYESLEALRTAVRTELEGQRERENQRALEEKVVDTLLARHQFQVPSSMVRRQVGHLIERARDRLRRQGVDPDRVPWDYQKLSEELWPGAERVVRRALLLEVVADREGITVSEEEEAAEVERIAAASQRPAPAVRRLLERSGDLDALRFSLREARTLDRLIQHGVVTS